MALRIDSNTGIFIQIVQDACMSTFQTAILGVLFSSTLAVNAWAAASKANVLLEPWTGPYGGVPPFDRVTLSDFKPAITHAIALQEKEIEAIASQKEPPTFDNTMVTLEKAGQILSQVLAIYHVWGSNLSTPEFRKLEPEIDMLLSEANSRFFQNAKLFRRIEALHLGSDKSSWTPEQQRLVWVWYQQFLQHGAKLSRTDQKRVAKISKRLAKLYAQFSQNQLADETDDVLILEKMTDLDGLPQSLIDAAKEEAVRRGKSNVWMISNTRSAMEPFLTYAHRRDLREKAFKLWASRGDQANANNNLKIISEIVSLRFERSKILGFETFAHWNLADTMAKIPQTALDLLLNMWAPARDQFRRDVSAMLKLAQAQDASIKTIEPWDTRYYTEKLRKQTYDLDMNEFKPYLRLGKVRDAMFSVAEALYDLSFTPVSDVPVFSPEVRVYKVMRQGTELVGLWYFDPFARPGKRSGAWMTAYRAQDKLVPGGTLTLVSNNSNFIAAKDPEETLLSWDDASTMFHEFGHALHGLNSRVTYPSLSGTATTRDFVEFPSQIHERFLKTSKVLNQLTDAQGRRLPAELLAKLEKAQTFNQGFLTLEYLASAIVDMKLHLLKDPKVDAARFEKTTLDELGMPRELVMRHRLPHFAHLFSSEGYAAGYYSYLWSDVMSADAFEAFLEKKNPYHPEVAKRFTQHIMSVGNSVDPQETYRHFRGRDPKVDALLRVRGFAAKP